MICDFINDFGLTFPEYSEKLDKYSSVDSSGSGRRTLSEENITELYQHCKKIYPVRFFDVLYKNTEMFTKCGAGAGASAGASRGTEVNVHFCQRLTLQMSGIHLILVIKHVRLL